MKPGQPAPVKLWQPGDLPRRLPGIQPDLPQLTPYPVNWAKVPTPAVLICPGGGYQCLCDSYEGHQIARWLNSFGLAGFVLHYRHAPHRHPVPLLDATRAMRLLRRNASAWNLDPGRVGIMGFSAGGHLAATLATRDSAPTDSVDSIQRHSAKPDFQVLIYPVITLAGPHTHRGTRDSLLGPDASLQLCEALSAHVQVNAETPPAFVVHSTADTIVPVQNSRLYVQALKARDIPVEYLELTSGDHGLGCGQGPEWETWQAHAEQWLRNRLLQATAPTQQQSDCPDLHLGMPKTTNPPPVNLH